MYKASNVNIMKYFLFNEELDYQLKIIDNLIRRHKNGKTVLGLKQAGLKYKKMYGVSIIHLREISKETAASNELAERLWYREVRETKILATMLAIGEDMLEEDLMDWAAGVSNIELAEQISFNLLGKRKGSENIINKWVTHPIKYVRYAALMSIGWQFKLAENTYFDFIRERTSTLEAMLENPFFSRAISHCLRMGIRYHPFMKPFVANLVKGWSDNSAKHIQELAKELLFELD